MSEKKTISELTSASVVNPSDLFVIYQSGSTFSASGSSIAKGISREVLTANRTYYVATTGSDSNDGLSASSPFLTIQKAIDVAATLDTSIYNVTIQIADGTYLANTITCKNVAGAGSVTIQGNSTTNTNVVIDGGFTKTSAGTQYILKDFRMEKVSSSASSAIKSSYNANIQFSNINFYTGFNIHIDPAYGGQIIASGNYQIASGSATVCHISCGAFSYASVVSRTITLSGSPNFTSSFVATQRLSLTDIYSNTFSGSATGKRYNVIQNGVIFTNSSGSAYLPGDTAGTTATGGQYI